MRTSRLALALLFALLFLSAAACRRRTYTIESPAVRRGHTAYLRYCALCHGKKAEGYAADHANALGNRDFLAIATNDFLRKSITDGRPGTPMSSWGRVHGGPLDPSQVEDIVAYLRSLARRQFVRVDAIDSEGESAGVLPARRPIKVTGDAQRGAPVWAERCQSCHGARGEGTPKATSVTHPNFLKNVSDGYLRTTIAKGRSGTLMEAFSAPKTGAPLSPQNIDDLVAYIRTLEAMPGPPPPPNYEPPPGLDQLVLNPTNPPPKFALRDGRYVSSADVAKALTEKKRLVILDARPTPDWSRNHVAGALPFPFYDIEKMASSLPRDGTFILAYCACPHAASGHVVDELRKRGFKNTAVIDEGITFWTTKGYPTAQAKIVEK